MNSEKFLEKCRYLDQQITQYFEEYPLHEVPYIIAVSVDYSPLLRQLGRSLINESKIEKLYLENEDNERDHS